MLCAVCISTENQEPAEPITIIHGYAVCITHLPLMQPGTIWPDVLHKAKLPPEPTPIRNAPPPPPIKPTGPVAKAANGVDIWGAILKDTE
jgi:hypothetical protein